MLILLKLLFNSNDYFRSFLVFLASIFLKKSSENFLNLQKLVSENYSYIQRALYFDVISCIKNYILCSQFSYAVIENFVLKNYITGTNNVIKI